MVPLLLAALLGASSGAAAAPAPADPTAGPAGALPCLALVSTPARAFGASEELERLYRSGVSFAHFLDGARRRRAAWVRNHAEGDVDDDLVARARALPGRWYVLAIAVDSCSDSVSTIPFLALLEERVPGLEMRIVEPRAGRTLMDTRRTPDGRTATPTLLLLDADFEDAGCFVERPRDLQSWWLENEGRLDPDALYAGKMEWYARDGGRSTVAEVVGLLEAAARGEPRCGAE